MAHFEASPKSAKNDQFWILSQKRSKIKLFSLIFGRKNSKNRKMRFSAERVSAIEKENFPDFRKNRPESTIAENRRISTIFPRKSANFGRFFAGQKLHGVRPCLKQGLTPCSFWPAKMCSYCTHRHQPTVKTTHQLQSWRGGQGPGRGLRRAVSQKPARKFPGFPKISPEA